MKTKLLLCALGALCVSLFTGCAFRTIDAAATKVKIGGAEIQLAKNIKADDLVFSYNPATKQIEFKVAKIESDASGVIKTAGEAQAEAIGRLTGTVADLTSLVTRFIVPTPLTPAASTSDFVGPLPPPGLVVPPAIPLSPGAGGDLRR
jgi:hypothetical protein